MIIQTTMCDSEEDLIELFTRKEKDEIEVNISLLIDDFIEIIRYVLVMKILRIYYKNTFILTFLSLYLKYILKNMLVLNILLENVMIMLKNTIFQKYILIVLIAIHLLENPQIFN